MLDWNREVLNFSDARNPLTLFCNAARSGSTPQPTAEITPQPAMTTSGSRIQRQLAGGDDLSAA